MRRSSAVRWLARLGGGAYEFAVVAEPLRERGAVARFGLPYWSLAGYLKLAVKNAVPLHVELRACRGACRAQARLDGIVCGHIHRPEIRDIDGVLYCNDGDWVESCTALVEDNERPPVAVVVGGCRAGVSSAEKLVEVAA